MSGGFFVDADDQRAKARRAEQRLLEHSASRTPRHRPSVDEDPVEASLPPVFRKEGYYQTARETSVDRRAARFRDGLPPPPPPVPPDEIPRLLPPPLPPLVPPAQVQQPMSLPYSPDATWKISPISPLPTAEDLFDLEADLTPDQEHRLSPSQKKRLRRKRKKEEQRLQQQVRRPAPMPLAVDQRVAPQAPNGVHPTHPEITQTACNAEVIARMPDGTIHRLRCPLKPFPHPNQPHMLQLAPAYPETSRAEIFVGFWLEGE